MIRIPFLAAFALLSASTLLTAAEDTLIFKGKAGPGSGKHIVIVTGDEEYRSEESGPMLGKILSQKHGFDCTVVFSWSEGYIDPNNQGGLKGLAALDSADLMIIGTRFRQPNAEEAAHVTKFLNAGKPVIGFRTATHAFTGDGKFGDGGGAIGFGQFGRKVLGEQWVSHHGGHKSQGARGVIEEANKDHAVLNGVTDVFAPSDVYGVRNLTDADTILMRGAVTKTLDPKSPNVEGGKNDPMQPFVWLHPYTAPDGKTKGNSLCTTAGASVDFVSEGLRRVIVNGSYHLTGLKVPDKADVSYVDPFYPSFYGFIGDAKWWPTADFQAEDFGLGKAPHQPDPKGSPDWAFRPVPE
jgi:hypothetical protein